MKNKYYLYDWENSTKDEILDEFEFEGDRSEIEILFASYTYEDYLGEAFLIVKKENKLYEVNAEHCSCYGLEEQFELEETSIEQLEFYLEEGNKFGYYCYGADFIKEQLVDFIKNYKE
jgi:hypothetical protein